jgi:hypothetical protein
VIDFHAHRPSERGLWGLGSYLAEDYLRFMDEIGIDRSVIFTTDGLIGPSRETNDDVASFVAEAPDRLIGFGTVDPRAGASVDEARRCLVELGFAGFKFHPWLQGFAPHEPGTRLDDIADLTAAHGGVLVFHDGTPPYSTPLQIAVLARRHPDVPFVLGHAGLHDMWRETIAAVLALPNVYACLCGTPRYAMDRIFAECPAGQILFGSDAGVASDAHQPYVRDRVEAFADLAIPAELRQAILFDNPRRLLAAHLS